MPPTQVYFLSRGTLKPANRQYTSINNEYELTLNNDSAIEPCVEEDVSIPSVQFDFKSIGNLEDTPEDSMIGRAIPVGVLQWQKHMHPK